MLLQIVAMIASTAGWVQAQPPPIENDVAIARKNDDAVGPDEYEVRLDRVEYGAGFVLPSASDFIRQSEFDGIQILPRFSVVPRHGRFVISRSPRVVLSRAVDMEGAELLGPNGRLINDHPGFEFARFVFPRNQANTHGPSQYVHSVTTFATSLTLRRLPTQIALLEGEVEIEEVIEDIDHEFLLTGQVQTETLAPGITLLLEPNKNGRGDNLATCAVAIPEARLPDGRLPVVNFIGIGPGGSGPLNVWPKPAGPDLMVGRAQYFVPDPESGNGSGRAHIVLKTRTVRVPFRHENIPIAGGRNNMKLDGVGQPSADSFVVRQDDYEVGLTGVTSRGEHTFSSHESKRSVKFSLAVRDRREGRRLGRFCTVSIDEMIDAAGEAAGQPALAVLHDDRGTGGSRRYLPQDMLEVDGPVRAGPRLSRPFSVTVPCDHLPSSLGKLRGEISFLEVTRELAVRLKLEPTEGLIEIAPGVRMQIQDHKLAPGDRYGSPPNDWVLFVLDLPQGTGAGTGDMPVPWLNVVQPISANGKAGIPFDSFAIDRTSGGAVIRVGTMAHMEQAAELHLHIVLETKRVVIPFEFKDIPLTGH